MGVSRNSLATVLPHVGAASNHFQLLAARRFRIWVVLVGAFVIEGMAAVGALQPVAEDAAGVKMPHTGHCPELVGALRTKKNGH